MRRALESRKKTVIVFLCSSPVYTSLCSFSSVLFLFSESDAKRQMRKRRDTIVCLNCEPSYCGKRISLTLALFGMEEDGDFGADRSSGILEAAATSFCALDDPDDTVRLDEVFVLVG